MWFTNDTNSMGVFGVVASLLAVGIVLLHIALGPIEDPSPFAEQASAMESNLAMTIVNTLSDTDQSEPMTMGKGSIHLNKVVKYLVIALAVVSILFGAIGMLRARQWEQGTIAIVIASSLLMFYFTTYYCWGTLSCYLR
ncbi:MAG: hypothetical protein AB2687_03480 [Candidatus Thiodiazotropha taylori]